MRIGTQSGSDASTSYPGRCSRLMPVRSHSGLPPLWCVTFKPSAPGPARRQPAAAHHAAAAARAARGTARSRSAHRTGTAGARDPAAPPAPGCGVTAAEAGHSDICQHIGARGVSRTACVVPAAWRPPHCRVDPHQCTPNEMDHLQQVGRHGTHHALSRGGDERRDCHCR